MEKHLEKALHQMVTFLESHKYRYALIGGIALAQWGQSQLLEKISK